MSTQLQLRRCQPSETHATKSWVAAHHYLQCAPPGFGFILEFYERGELVGGGRTSGADRKPTKCMTRITWCSSYRVFFVDETEHCVESQALGMARKYIRTWNRQIRLVLSYSDPSVGHEGTIYFADNWCPLGLTRERHDYGFQTHKGRERTKRDVSAKVRWVRTP